MSGRGDEGDEEDVACFSFPTGRSANRDATRSRSVSVGFTRRVGDEGDDEDEEDEGVEEAEERNQ
ncbi:hypothetical protein [Anabaena sp. CA = ATCC 33047]|uniref:hypothetical protein n=1 Tax=Anabaena sp. (strain CA / ATCC 33047) TaxID=52271 RepID=UPI000830A8E6|nr:hypothetical protein [Anabaena sp. CA = ATCC 33047]